MPQWVIPQQRAQEAYNIMMERSRWRGLGIRIFGSRTIPQFTPGATLAFQSVNTQLRPLQIPTQPPSAQAMRHLMHQQMPQQFPARHMPQGTPHGQVIHSMPPPPMNVLRSQPHAQPIPTYPNGMPIQPTMGPGMPVGMPQRMSNMPPAHPSPAYGLHGNQMQSSLPANKG